MSFVGGIGLFVGGGSFGVGGLILGAGSLAGGFPLGIGFTIGGIVKVGFGTLIVIIVPKVKSATAVCTEGEAPAHAYQQH